MGPQKGLQFGIADYLGVGRDLCRSLLGFWKMNARQNAAGGSSGRGAGVSSSFFSSGTQPSAFSSLGAGSSSSAYTNQYRNLAFSSPYERAKKGKPPGKSKGPRAKQARPLAAAKEEDGQEDGAAGGGDIMKRREKGILIRQPR